MKNLSIFLFILLSNKICFASPKGGCLTQVLNMLEYNNRSICPKTGKCDIKWLAQGEHEKVVNIADQSIGQSKSVKEIVYTKHGIEEALSGVDAEKVLIKAMDEVSLRSQEIGKPTAQWVALRVTNDGISKTFSKIFSSSTEGELVTGFSEVLSKLQVTHGDTGHNVMVLILGDSAQRGHPIYASERNVVEQFYHDQGVLEPDKFWALKKTNTKNKDEILGDEVSREFFFKYDPFDLQ